MPIDGLMLGILLGLAASACWGVADFLARGVTRRYGDFETLLGVLVVGGIGVALYVVPQGVAPVLAGDRLTIVITALLAVGGYAALYRALKVGVLSVVSPIAAGNAVIPVGLALILLGERPLPWQLAGGACVLAGVALLSIQKGGPHPEGQNLQEGAAPPRGRIALGVAPALLCALLFGMSLFGMKLSVDRIDPNSVALWVRIIGVAALLLWLLAARRVTLPPAGCRLPLVAAGLLDAAAFVFFCEALTHTLLSLVAPVSATIPLFTVTLARVLLKERLSGMQQTGLALTLSGLALVALD
ncbi:MAG: DMT family transporter [Nitrospirota bacterium]|nr:DMT family transporter [Nitrospirota bacterium]